MKTRLLSLFGAALLFATACKKEECTKPAALPPACSLAPDPGVCRAAFVRYYYDPKDGKCKQFTWGGCGGVVPFATLQECQVCEGN